MFLYNRKTGTKKTTNRHFGNNKIVNFDDLTEKFFKHFSKYCTPIMIDDVSCAYGVLGIKKMTNENVVLWIADSHKTSKNEGLYYLELDKFGNKIACTGVDYEDQRNGLSTAERLNIQLKTGWLILFPKNKKVTE